MQSKHYKIIIASQKEKQLLSLVKKNFEYITELDPIGENKVLLVRSKSVKSFNVKQSNINHFRTQVKIHKLEAFCKIKETNLEINIGDKS